MIFKNNFTYTTYSAAGEMLENFNPSSKFSLLDMCKLFGNLKAIKES